MGNPGTRAVGQAKDVAEDAGRSRWARTAVLVGWAAKGVVYLSLAWLVLQLAFGSPPEEASTTGALEHLASSPVGVAAMVVLGIGLLAYAVGRVLEVTVMALPSVETSDKAIGFVLAVVYAAMAFTAFGIAGFAGGGSGGGGGSGEEEGASFVFGLPGGQWIVAVIGLVVAGIGLLMFKEAADRSFLATLRTGEMSPALRTWAERLGLAAYAAKGVIFLLVAWFLVQAALTFDPAEAAGGLDGALRQVADATWGQVLLAAVAVGLLAYGLFCELEARYRRVGVSATGTA